MKLTKSRLQQIIKEELGTLALTEGQLKKFIVITDEDFIELRKISNELLARTRTETTGRYMNTLLDASDKSTFNDYRELYDELKQHYEKEGAD